MKSLFALLLLVSCATKSEMLDYMITLKDGTYICEEYLRGDERSDTYGDCEHVLLGTKLSEVTVKKTHPITPIADRFK